MHLTLHVPGLHGEAAARIVEYAEVLPTRGQVDESQQAYESVLRKAAEDHVLSPDIMRSYLRFCEKHQVAAALRRAMVVMCAVGCRWAVG